MLDKELRQSVQDVIGLEAPGDRDRQALARVLINDRQHPDRLAVMGAGGDEVIGPDVVGPIRPETNAGPVVEPEAPRFGCRFGTLSPSRHQIRSTRLWFTAHPSARSRAVIRR